MAEVMRDPELSIVARCFFRADVFVLVEHLLVPGDFSDMRCGQIWAALLRLYRKRPVDNFVEAVTEYLAGGDMLDAAALVEHFVHVFRAGPRLDDLEPVLHHVAAIKEASVKRARRRTRRVG